MTLLRAPESDSDRENRDGSSAATFVDRRKQGSRRSGHLVLLNTPVTPMAGLSVQLLASLAHRGVQRCYPAKALLLHEADPSHHLFVVISGRLKVFGTSRLGRDVIFRTLGPGDVFGELGLDGGASSTSVMTLQRSSCALLQNAHVPGLMAEFPDFGQFLFGRLLSQVRAGNANVKQLALDTAYQRLARFLDNLEHTLVMGKRTLHERLTQQALGERIGCSREMISRLLLRMRKEGHIAIEGQRIVLLRDSFSQIA